MLTGYFLFFVGEEAVKSGYPGSCVYRLMKGGLGEMSETVSSSSYVCLNG